MKRITSIIFLFLLLLNVTTYSQLLSDFETGGTNNIVVNGAGTWYDGNLFNGTPGLVPNPDVTGINETATCVQAINVKDANWWGNFIFFTLNNPVTITQQNRYLKIMCYRSIQPKNFTIGINGIESTPFVGKLTQDGLWQDVVIDLGVNYLNTKVNFIEIILSDNWDAPQSGWGEAKYLFDQFELSDNFLPRTKKIIDGGSKTGITIDNVLPRYDTNGSIIDAHDGRVIKFGKTYYWYGTAYGNTDGFVTTNHYQSYKSTDLTAWMACGNMLINPPTGVYYRPHVVYNAKQKKYVMWYNWYPTLWNGQFGVATSDNPEGPYTIANQNVNVKNLSKGVGDFSLFVDEDGKGYIVYTTIIGHTISVELLTDDYLGSLQTNSGVILPNAEACNMFKRNGLYYMLADRTCAFCPEGSGAQVYTSAYPLGPYNYRGNINNLEKSRYPASATIDGDRIGADWGISGGWNDNTEGYFPDSLEFTFNGAKSISEVDVFTIQDGSATTPTEIMTFANNGITAFDVEYWDGISWKIIPGGSISGNNLVWRKISFTAVTTNKIRLIVRSSKSNDFSRLVELEAFENGVNVAAKANGGSVRASSEYLDASDNIIHGQQTHIAEIPTVTGTAYLWMADRWGSRPDGIKGHDFQYWSSPLVFNADGSIQKLSFVNSFTLDLASDITKLPATSKELVLKYYVNKKNQLVLNSALQQSVQIQILNVSGIQLVSKQVKMDVGSSIEVDLSFPKGVYFVVLGTNEKKYSTKFIL